MQQQSPEWFAARIGHVTASRVADVVARTKTGWGASRANYMAELLVERLTGFPAPAYRSAAMQNGTDTEPLARAVYSFMQDVEVEETGFVLHPTIGMAGASPDGLVGADGLAEFKCPNTATHIDTLLSGKVAESYRTQMLWQMACTGRQWCDFVSFDPRVPESMQLFVRRIPRDADAIATLERDVTDFLTELDGKIAALRAKYAGGPAVVRQQLQQSILMAG